MPEFLPAFDLVRWFDESAAIAELSATVSDRCLVAPIRHFRDPSSIKALVLAVESFASVAGTTLTHEPKILVRAALDRGPRSVVSVRAAVSIGLVALHIDAVLGGTGALVRELSHISARNGRQWTPSDVESVVKTSLERASNDPGQLLVADHLGVRIDPETWVRAAVRAALNRVGPERLPDGITLEMIDRAAAATRSKLRGSTNVPEHRADALQEGWFHLDCQLKRGKHLTVDPGCLPMWLRAVVMNRSQSEITRLTRHKTGPLPEGAAIADPTVEVDEVRESFDLEGWLRENREALLRASITSKSRWCIANHLVEATPSDFAEMWDWFEEQVASGLLDHDTTAEQDRALLVALVGLLHRADPKDFPLTALNAASTPGKTVQRFMRDVLKPMVRKTLGPSDESAAA